MYKRSIITLVICFTVCCIACSAQTDSSKQGDLQSDLLQQKYISNSVSADDHNILLKKIDATTPAKPTKVVPSPKVTGKNSVSPDNPYWDIMLVAVFMSNKSDVPEFRINITVPIPVSTNFTTPTKKVTTKIKVTPTKSVLKPNTTSVDSKKK